MEVLETDQGLVSHMSELLAIEIGHAFLSGCDLLLEIRVWVLVERSDLVEFRAKVALCSG